MSEWVNTKLGRVLGSDGYIRGPFGSSLLRDKMLTQGIPVYEQQHAICNHRNFRFFIDERKHKELERFTVKENDLIISCSGTLGKVSIIKKDDPKGIISQALLILRPEINNIDVKFLYFFLTSPVGFNSIVSVSSGSVQTNIAKRSIIENTEILLPSLPEQRAIVGVLSSLDDKIDLLHRQNKTLEEMAESLWRKMFMEEAEETWKTAAVKDLINILSGFAFKSADFVDTGKYRLITIKNVQDGYLDLSRTDYLGVIPAEMPDYCFLQNGDILLSLTGNVGRCCLVNEENLLLNQRVAKLQARNVRDSAFTYIMFRQKTMRIILEELAKGTAQANLSPVETANYETQIPPDALLEKYSEEATPLIEKALSNFNQIRTITRLRDTLLPKLISGEVRVRI